VATPVAADAAGTWGEIEALLDVLDGGSSDLETAEYNSISNDFWTADRSGAAHVGATRASQRAYRGHGNPLAVARAIVVLRTQSGPSWRTVI
jgi:hypothetical protein